MASVPLVPESNNSNNGATMSNAALVPGSDNSSNNDVTMSNAPLVPDSNNGAMMSNAALVPGSDNSSNNEVIMSNIPLVPDSNNSINGAMTENHETDLTFLSKEDLANLVFTIISSNPNLTSSVVTQSYIKKSKVNRKLWIQDEIAENSSQVGFNASLKLNGSSPLNTTEFHPFSRLPPELRVKIWKLLFPTSRVVKLFMKFKNNWKKAVVLRHRISRDDFRRYAYDVHSKTAAPIGFHINKESRIETMKHYTPMFDTPGQNSLIYVNFSTDIITWEPPVTQMYDDWVWEFVDQMRGQDSCQGIQRLAISLLELEQIMENYQDLSFMRYFGSLHELFIDVGGASEKARAECESLVNFRYYYPKMLCLKKGVWLDGIQNETSNIKTAIKGVRSEFEQFTNEHTKGHQDWKAPTLRFGTMCRLDLNEEIAALEKEMARLDRELEAMD